MTARPRPELATEFRGRIFGRHSAELQELLNTMRAAPMPGKPFLFLSKPGQEWTLSKYADSLPLRPVVEWDHVFSDIESAEWHVFGERWAAMHGERLEPPTVPSPPADPAEAARRAVLERCPSVLAYASARSIRAGESLDFFVSSEGDKDYTAEVVRLLSPDIGPVAPAFRTVPVASAVNGTHAGRYQRILIGSYAEVAGPIALEDGFTLSARVHPTLRGAAVRTIAHVMATSGAHLTITNSDEGLTATWIAPSGSRTVASVRPLVEREWADVAVTVEPATGTLTLTSTVVDAPALRTHARQVATATGSSSAPFGPSSLALAASLSSDGRHDPATCFNGKLEDVRIVRTTHTDLIAHWDFSQGMTTQGIVDVSGRAHHGRLVNLPTRATRGSRWTGDSLAWTVDPSGYAAIHFHEDDLADAAWERSLTFDAPSDLPSGIYGLRVAPADGSTPEFWVPFVVRPAKGARTAPAAFILPTTTYCTYANMHLRVNAQFNELNQGRLTVLDSTDFLLMAKPELGKSCYDTHTDGSPVIFASMNRPVANFRPFGRIYKFCQDLMFVDWFDATDMDVDIITDDDIDREGIDAIRPYRALLTASHPEYMSRKFLDAVDQHLREGGRLMYLGGNGFYQMAEVPESMPHVVEVRRPGQDNLWRVNHAEALSSTSGLPTGLWRNIGRSENAMVGVGFLTMGFDECAPYRRNPAAQDPRAAWIFAGLGDAELIGDFGVLQGGAAGYEIDRHDAAKGSPAHSLVVASSFGHSNMYGVTSSSVLDTLPNPGSDLDNLRADMVFFETGHGGAVFSVGSIAWCGSLSHNGYRNSVSTVMRNVLERFVDPAPFPMPEIR